MCISDDVTDVKYMSRVGIVRSIAQQHQTSPEQAFVGLAQKAARRASRNVGANIEYINGTLRLIDEFYIPEALILRRFKEALLYFAKQEAGIA